MADIEKVAIGTTSYDIKDATAFHDKSAAATSIVESKAGSTTYPSNGVSNTYNVVLGSGALIYNTSSKYSTIIGANAKFSYNSTSSPYYATVIGYGANCASNYSTALGANSTARAYSVAVGAYAQNGTSYQVTIGYNIITTGTYSVSIGYNTKTGTSYDIAIGSGAQITSTKGYSVQLGYGTNANGGLQYRTWQLLDTNGIIPIERIPKDMVVTTTDPLPNPQIQSVGTTQMYLGADTDTFKKNHMYSVAEDRTMNRAFPMDYNPNPSAWPDYDPLRDVQVDANKFVSKVSEIVYLHGGKPIDSTSSGMWNNRYVPIYYTGTNPSSGVPARMFYVGASYEYKSETLYYDYTNGPYITQQELEDDWGITIDWSKVYLPNTLGTVCYIILADKFFLYDYIMGSSTYFYTCAKFNYYDMLNWCENPIILDNGEQYKLQSGDQLQLIWYGNSSIDPSAGGAWWIQMIKNGEVTPHHVQPPQDGQHSIYNYWTTDELKRDWGLSDVGTGLYANRSAISNTKFRVGWEYGHKWIESSFDLRNVDGYSTTENQVLKNTNGYIQWGAGGSSGTTDYDELYNKPKINGYELNGDCSLGDIGAASESNLDDVEGRVWTLEGQVGTMTFWSGTLAEYNNISVKDANTLYIIKG